MTAMQLVLPDGRTLAGADAVPELLRRIRGLGWLATAFAPFGVRGPARRVYAWIARIACVVASSAARRFSSTILVALKFGSGGHALEPSPGVKYPPTPTSAR